MKESALRPQAYRPYFRKGSYIFLAVLMGTIGFLTARMGYRDKVWHYMISGTLLPFAFVIGEFIRNYLYFKKFKAVRCKKCKHEFAMKTLLKTGRCPECRSKRIVGLLP